MLLITLVTIKLSTQLFLLQLTLIVLRFTAEARLYLMHLETGLVEAMLTIVASQMLLFVPQLAFID